MEVIVEGCRLSAQQKRLWALRESGSAFPFTVRAAAAIEGELEAQVLRAALEDVVGRHEILRTVFRRLPQMKMPLQVITEQRPEWEERPPATDGGGWRPAAGRVFADARPFEPENDPPLRATLMALGDGSYLLTCELSALCGDRTTLELLLRELALAYAARRQAPLPGDELAEDEPLQYADFADWQRELLAAAEADYWGRPELAEDLAFEVLQTGVRGTVDFAPQRLDCPLPADALRRLEDLAGRLETIPSVLVLTAWSALLGRLAGRSDLVVGVGHDGRGYEELAGALGPLGQYLPVRCRLTPEIPFAQLAERVHATLKEAAEHQEYFSYELLRGGGEDVAAPLLHFTAGFDFEEKPAPIVAGGARFAFCELSAQTDRIDLRLSCVADSGRLAAEIHYNAALFARRDVARLAVYLRCLLADAVERPQVALGDLEFLPPSERHQVLAEWNDSAAGYPRELCLHELVEAQIARTPDLKAVVCGEAEVTYRQLERRANRLARHLRDLGVGPDVLVGICLERSPRMVESFLAVLKAGGAYLPLDPGYPRERLRYMMEDAGVPVLISEGTLPEHLNADTVRTVLLDRDAETIARQSPDRPAGRARPENLAYVLYTSGSTGRPKGVMVPHSTICNHMFWMQEAFPLGPGDAVVQKTPMSFDASVWEFYAPLMDGARLVVARPGGHKEPAYLVSLVAAQNAGTLQVVPSLLRLLLEEPGLGSCGLERMFCGGEALSPDLVKDHERRLPGVALINVYGPTEATIHSAFQRCDRLVGRAAVAIGRNVGNVRVHLLDPRGRLVPLGMAGDLHVGGLNVGRGYLGRSALTAARFVPDPFDQEGGGRLYRTGDLVRYLPDGRLDFLGRVDHQVKFRGYRVELGEIEAVLSGHPSVRQSVVVVLAGREGQRLVAYAVPRAGAALVADELRARAQEVLPDYMVPTAWAILDELPLTPNGKVDRRALPEPDAPGAQAEQSYTAPRTPAEEKLAAIWAAVLGVERVGVESDFFELGGDSILTLQIVGRAYQEGIHVTPRELFEHRTIAALASVASAAAAPVADAGPVVGPIPLTPIQCAFFERELVDLQHYDQAFLLEIREELDAGVLDWVVKRVVTHHDALRLRFETSDGGWRQINADIDEAPASLLHLDLSRLSDAAWPAALERAATCVQAGFDLGRPPLFKMAFFDLGADRPGRLLLAAHHLVVDAVSWQVLLEDLENLYRSAREGRPFELPPKTTSYQSWAERLAEHAGAETVAAELDYWLSAPRRRVAPLPVDRPVTTTWEATAQRVTFALDAETTRQFLQGVPMAYRTRPDEILLTALARACGRWTGSSALLVDLEGHGREELFDGVDLTRTVGWFTALYPVLLDLASTEGPGEAIKAVKEQVRGVPSRGLGYGLLRHLDPDGSRAERLAAMPPAQISFNYLGQLDRPLAASELFAPALESIGPDQSPRQSRRYLLEVSGGVVGGRLELGLRYGPEQYEDTTIEALATDFRSALEELVSHCRSPEAGGYTPSDFPLATLDAAALDRVLATFGDVEDVYALSPLQQGLLFHALRTPEAGLYFQQFSCTLEGELDEAAFCAAWQEQLDRHPVLRTAFAWEELAEPLQVVLSRVELPVARHDWRRVAEAERAGRLEDFLEHDRRCGFDLHTAPLMRLELIRLSETTHYLVWSHHHLLLDGWSVPLLIARFFAVYEALRRGATPAPAPSRPFRDYVEWLHRQDLSAAESFWRQRLRGFTSPTRLPGRSSSDRPARHFYRQIEVDAVTTAALGELARRHQLTLPTLVQGAWGLLLARSSGEADVVFGTTTAGRPAELAGVGEMLGVFINTLPTRLRVRSGEPFLPWLAKLQAREAEARQYEFTRLVDIQRWSDVPPGMALFDSILVFENYPVEETVDGGEHGFEVRDARLEAETNYPLTLVSAASEELPLRLVYDSVRFDVTAVARMLEQLRAVLREMLADPQRLLGAMAVLTRAEKQQLLYEWGPGNPASERFEPQPEATLHEVFERQAARRPEAVALVCGETRLNYRQLGEEAEQLARYLRSCGAGPGTRVGLLVERSAEMVVALIGILKAGASYLPLDPHYPAERLAFMLEDAGARLVLTERDLADRLPAERERILLDSDRERIAAVVTAPAARGTSAADEAYVIYTSGSTGRPKGVSVSHGHVLRLFTSAAERFTFGAGDVWSLFHSYAFDFSVWEIWGALLHGGRLVVVPYWVSRSPEAFYELLAEEQVTVLSQTPSAFRQLVQVEKAKVRDLALSYVIFGGEAADLPSLRPWCQHHGDRRPELINMYGITETTVHVTWRRLEAADLAAAATPVGRPLADLKVVLLDRRLWPVPMGSAGEICVGGAGVARGYVRRPALTAGRFVPDPWSERPGARLYRSGDLARYRSNGELEFLGRLDTQIKIRGFRVEPGEIEAALLEHPGVREAVVLAQGEKAGVRLVAYVTAAGPQPPSAGGLYVFLGKRLPDHMVVSSFVWLDELPLTPSGKLDRRALAAVEPCVAAPEGASAALRNPIEEVLAGIWKEVLGVERVTPDDDFFLLGGHSLFATQVVSRLRETLRVELPLASVFEHTVLVDLARQVDAAARRRHGLEAPPITRVETDDSAPLSFAQQRLWFHDRLEPGLAVYFVPAAVRILGELETEILKRSLEEVIRRHEVLHTRFGDVDGRPVQVVEPPWPLRLPVVDLSALPPAERLALARRLAARQTEEPFRLDRLPLLRLCLLRFRPEEHVFLLTAHHIVADAWSMGVLMREIVALYQAFAAGERSPLSELPVQYSDFARWQRQWLRGAVWDTLMGYWKRRLSGAPQVIDLDADRPPPARLSHRGATRLMRLPPELSRKLATLSHREGATLYMTLLAAYKALLFVRTGQTDLVLGSNVAGRNRMETEGLIGFFVNMLVLRTDLSGDPSFRELLGRVREVTLGAYAHQDVPFDKLVDELGLKRSLAHSPLFQAVFTLQNTPLPEIRIPGLTLEPLEFESRTTPFELIVNMFETADGLGGVAQYSLDLFDDATIRRLLEDFETVLSAVTEQPDIRLSELGRVLSEAGRQQLSSKSRDFQAVLDQAFKNRRRAVKAV